MGRDASAAAGLVVLVVIAGAVGFSVATYNKTFVDVTTVMLDADRAGNQLSKGADVKIRGLIVGEVREVSSSGQGARLELALQPEMADTISSDVTAQLVPKTLFGEKFVSLLPGTGPAGLSDGDVIGQDRSATSVETARVLDRLLPLLQALNPDDVSRTLNALSGAVRGRGEQLGANAVATRDYLAGLNPALPTLQQDLVGLADLADTYDEAAPDLLSTLDDLSFSSRSLVDQQDELSRFLQTTTGFSDSGRTLLEQNEQRLIRLASESLPGLRLYAETSVQFGCFLRATDFQNAEGERTFGGNQPGLAITLEVTRDLEGYTPGQEPLNGQGLPPRLCYNTGPDKEQPARVYYNPIDGYRDGERVDPETGRPADEEAAQASQMSVGDPALVALLLGPALG